MAAVWPKLMGFWIAPRASGAETQRSVFVHVETSHPEALECVLPTETNNFSLYTIVPPVCPVIYPSLLFLTFLRFKPVTLGTVLGVITDCHPATRTLRYRRTYFLLLFSFYLHYSLSSLIFFSPATAFKLPLFINNLYFKIFSLLSVCVYFRNSFTSVTCGLTELVLLQHLSSLFPLFWRKCPRTGHSCVLAAYGDTTPCTRCSLDSHNLRKKTWWTLLPIEGSLHPPSFAIVFWNDSPLV